MELNLENIYSELDELFHKIMLADEYPEFVPSTDKVQLLEAISSILDYLKEKVEATDNRRAWYIIGDYRKRYYQNNKVSYVEPFSEEPDSHNNDIDN